MDYKPFLQTVDILITRAKVDQRPPDYDLLLASLTILLGKYSKLASMKTPQPVKDQLARIIYQLQEYETMLRGTPYKDYWMNEATAFLSVLRVDPLRFPMN